MRRSQPLFSVRSLFPRLPPPQKDIGPRDIVAVTQMPCCPKTKYLWIRVRSRLPDLARAATRASFGSMQTHTPNFTLPTPRTTDVATPVTWMFSRAACEEDMAHRKVHS